jgi:hypothetical protein
MKTRISLPVLRFGAVWSLLLTTLLFLPDMVVAQGDLMITPRRIVFEGNRDRQEITLANTGTDTARYTVSFVQYRMTVDGAFEQITEPDSGQMFADPFLRYFPRTVTLAPRESQVLRMQLRRTSDMVPGEYRSHMYFRAVPEERPLGEEDMIADTNAIGIRLTPIFGITIPVIIRVGEGNTTVTLSDTRIERRDDGTPWLHLSFNRNGNRSVYGDLIVEHIGAGGSAVQVGIVRGIAVYTPNSLRRFAMQLTPPDGSDLSSGRLIIRFVSGTEARPEVFAESELRLSR